MDALQQLLAVADAVVFDVGETLVDETRAWTEQAHAVGTTPFTLMAALGAVIDRGEDHRRVWDELGVAPPPPPRIGAPDLYPDALDCLRACRAAGLVVGVAGNQPAGAVEQLAAAGVEVDLIGSSAAWGAAKPDPAFFARMLTEIDAPPERVVHVGDRVDNDLLPARDAGMRTVLIRRGPWGLLQGDRGAAALADARIDSLAELTAAVPRR